MFAVMGILSAGGSRCLEGRYGRIRTDRSTPWPADGVVATDRSGPPGRGAMVESPARAQRLEALAAGADFQRPGRPLMSSVLLPRCAPRLRARGWSMGRRGEPVPPDDVVQPLGMAVGQPVFRGQFGEGAGFRGARGQ